MATLKGPGRFKVGDRARAELEGEVAAIWESGDVRLKVAGGGIDLNPRYLTLVKAPLPTTPGSVIRSMEAGSHRVLGTDNKWYLIYSPEQVRRSGFAHGAPTFSVRHEGLQDPDLWEIVYDAGKV